MLKRTAAVMLSLLIIIVAALPAFAEESLSPETDFITELNNPDGRVLGIAYRGEWSECPENSLAAVEAAAKTGIDAAAVDIRKTADGTLIVFADDTTKRMLASDTVYAVAKTDFATIKDFHLKNRSGGQFETTEYTIPTLEDMLECAEANGIGLVLNTDASLLPDVSNLLKEKNMLDTVAVWVNGSVKNIEAALAGCDEAPVLIGTIRNNVIFALRSYENGIEELGGSAVCLKTTNRYGVNFYKSHLSKLDGKLRAMADLSETKTAGWRTDCEQWWDDLISRGYSIIVTNEAQLFADYQKKTQEMHSTLEKALESAKSFPLPVYKTEIFNDYKKAYDDAVRNAEALSEDAGASLNEMSVAYAALVKAVNDLNLNFDELEEGTAGMTVSAKTIILCLFAVVLVGTAEIYVYKKRKKA